MTSATLEYRWCYDLPSSFKSSFHTLIHLLNFANGKSVSFAVSRQSVILKVNWKLFILFNGVNVLCLLSVIQITLDLKIMNGFSKVSYILYLYWMRIVILDFWHLYQKGSWGTLQNTSSFEFCYRLQKCSIMCLINALACAGSSASKANQGTTAFFIRDSWPLEDNPKFIKGNATM